MKDATARHSEQHLGGQCSGSGAQNSGEGYSALQSYAVPTAPAARTKDARREPPLAEQEARVVLQVLLGEGPAQQDVPRALLVQHPSSGDPHCPCRRRKSPRSKQPRPSAQSNEVSVT
jgi:hypothetical protein